MARWIHVVAAVIRGPQQEVLIAQRPADKHQGGLWEFPGGKVEPDEPVADALVRELQEELAITPTQWLPLIQVRHDYGDKAVLLDVYEVTAFTGDPHGMEGQPLRWVCAKDLSTYDFPAANGPIVRAAQLPRRWLITGDFDDVADFQQRLEGIQLPAQAGLILRAPQVTRAEYSALLDIARPWCRTQHIPLMVNLPAQWGSAPWSQLPPDVGLHLPSTTAAQLDQRPVTGERWLGVSCHTARELGQAERLGADYALLSPVLPTASHPEASGIGWQAFSELAENCALPVYALGGVGEKEWGTAREQGGQGVAGIRAYWPSSSKP